MPIHNGRHDCMEIKSFRKCSIALLSFGKAIVERLFALLIFTIYTVIVSGMEMYVRN